MNNQSTGIPDFIIRKASINDSPLILKFINELADYEKMSDQVVATEEDLNRHLFGEHPAAEVILGFFQNEPVGFALYFHNFSTFLGRPGIYLEDLYVSEKHRGKGFGKALLKHLAKTAVRRGCGRLEWAVLDWNEPSIKFYESIGAKIMNEWLINRLTGKELANFADD